MATNKEINAELLTCLKHVEQKLSDNKYQPKKALVFLQWIIPILVAISSSIAVWYNAQIAHKLTNLTLPLQYTSAIQAVETHIKTNENGTFNTTLVFHLNNQVTSGNIRGAYIAVFNGGKIEFHYLDNSKKELYITWDELSSLDGYPGVASFYTVYVDYSSNIYVDYNLFLPVPTQLGELQLVAEIQSEESGGKQIIVEEFNPISISTEHSILRTIMGDMLLSKSNYNEIISDLTKEYQFILGSERHMYKFIEYEDVRKQIAQIVTEVKEKVLFENQLNKDY